MMKRLILILATVLLCSSAWAATKVQVMTDGKIDVDKLPTIDFSLETDPASPIDGQIWWNETDKLLKVADPSGVYAFTGTLTAWDTTPAAFSFTDIANATAETTYTSDAITVSGINHPVAITVSGDASAKYSVNNAAATATAGTVDVGDTVRAVVTSSASASTAVNATVTIGGVSDAFSVTTAAVSGGGESVYVGWPNTDGTPTGTPSETVSLGTDGVATTRWVATEAGTAESIKVYMSAIPGTIQYQGVAIYKDISGTLTLIGSGSATLPTGVWSGEVALTAASGQTLAFAANDVLYFGVAVSTSDTIYLGRNPSGGTGNYYNNGLSNFSSPPSTVSLTTSAGRLNAIILEYVR